MNYRTFRDFCKTLTWSNGISPISVSLFAKSRENQRKIAKTQENHNFQENFTFRYIAEDEFGVPENAFIVCTFWMINSLYIIGAEKKAREMFVNIEGCMNHLGLLSEDVEIKTKSLIGNFPQGYSHLAYIQTILLLETEYNWSDAFKTNGG